MIMKRKDHGPHFNYIVRRGFTADNGEYVLPGYIPPPQRLAKWTNLAALVNSGYLEVYGGVSDDSSNEIKEKFESKIKVTKKKNLTACSVSGCNWKGERVKAHLTRSHKEI